MKFSPTTSVDIQGKLPVMIGNLIKKPPPPSTPSPSHKEMEFGREEVTPTRLKQLNKMKARRPIKDMASPMVSVDITDPSMADAEVMDMDELKAAVGDVEEVTKGSCTAVADVMECGGAFEARSGLIG